MKPIDPFEQFKAKKEVERLEKKSKGKTADKAAEEKKTPFDPDKSWIY
jgi:hypothetical protein